MVSAMVSRSFRGSETTCRSVAGIRLLITLLETARVQPASGLGHILHRQVLPFGRPLPPIRMEAEQLLRRVARLPIDITALPVRTFPLFVAQRSRVRTSPRRCSILRTQTVVQAETKLRTPEAEFGSGPHDETPCYCFGHAAPLRFLAGFVSTKRSISTRHHPRP